MGLLDEQAGPALLSEIAALPALFPEGPEELAPPNPLSGPVENVTASVPAEEGSFTHDPPSEGATGFPAPLNSTDMVLSSEKFTEPGTSSHYTANPSLVITPVSHAELGRAASKRTVWLSCVFITAVCFSVMYLNQTLTVTTSPVATLPELDSPHR